MSSEPSSGNSPERGRGQGLCALGVRWAWALAILTVLWAGEALACGPDTDCRIGERTYRMALPEGAGPYGAIVYMHGYRGTAAGAMGNAALRRVASELGVALIALKSGGPDWLIRNAPNKGFADDERELAYVDAVLGDAAGRAPIDRDRLLATGFSAGGMMTWTLACHRGDEFALFLPISGTFWAPIPTDCPAPAADLLHIHGTTDQVVPLAGRQIADTRQGDVEEAVALLSGIRDAPAPAALAFDGLALECTGSRGEDGLLALCLHEGGHSLRSEWIAWAYRTLVQGR